MPPFRFFSLVALISTILKSRYAKNYIATSITASFFLIFFSQLLAWLLWRWLLFPKFFSPLRHLPGPPNPSFFMGQFFYTLNRPAGESTHHWLESTPNNGIIRYLDIFNSERLTIVSPQALAEVLVHKSYDFVKPWQLRKGLGRILGIGIFLAEGEEHKRQRKSLAPAFAFRHIKNLYPIFWSKGEELIAALKSLTASDPEAIIDVNSWASRATLDIIGVAGLGRDFHAIADPNTDLNVTYRRLFSPSRWGRAIGILTFLLPGWIMRRIPTKRNDDIALASSVIMRTCHSLIAEKRHILQSQSTPSEVTEKEAANRDILSVALTSGNFSDDDLANQLMTFLVAGHETSAAAFSWSVYELCRSPQIQARLRQEVCAYLGPYLGPEDEVESADRKASRITAEIIDTMPYLSAFVAEVLRLWPPAPLTIRVADRDTSILGEFIPKDTVLMLSPWAINRSSALWGPDSLEFKPERWLGKATPNHEKDATTNGETHHDAKGKPFPTAKSEQANNAGGAESNFAQMTFLHGPRSCIGQGFAVGELKCLVASWVWSFKETRFATDGYELKVANGIAARPRDLDVRVRA